MNVGDIVTKVSDWASSSKTHRWIKFDSSETKGKGMVVEIIDDIHVPHLCKILWSSGEISKEYTDEVEKSL